MTLPPIPIFDPRPHTEPLLPALQARIAEVLRSGHYILGPEVEAFEREVAEYLGVRHAIGLNSGTDALVIGLRALGIAAADEVITTAFSFSATAESIRHAGATPVFVDIDPETFALDPNRIEAALTPRTRALVPVHLYGLAAGMDALVDIAARNGLAILEDVAQAFGARLGGRAAGTIGRAGAFSFFPTKNLGAVGDAGMIATDDDAVATEARALRAHGARRKYETETLGYNSRLDAIQAAVLRVKLPHVAAWNAARTTIAGTYAEQLEGVEGVVLPRVPAHATHVFHQFTIRVPADRRDAIRDELAAQGITTMVYYPVPLHRLAVYADLRLSCPEAERAAREVLSLPMYPGLSPSQIERVSTALVRALRKGS